MFFERMKKEIKRSLKVTTDKIKHPESLGANRKRDRSLIRAYPTLPTTEEVADETGTNETEKWVNNSSINKVAVRRANIEETMNSKPPDYDQSVRSQNGVAQGNHQMQYNQQFNQGMYQPTFPMNNLLNNALASSDQNFYQMQVSGTGNIPSREQTMEERKERMRQQLICGIITLKVRNTGISKTQLKKAYRRALKQSYF